MGLNVMVILGDSVLEHIGSYQVMLYSALQTIMK